MDSFSAEKMCDADKAKDAGDDDEDVDQQPVKRRTKRVVSDDDDGDAADTKAKAKVKAPSKKTKNAAAAEEEEEEKGGGEEDKDEDVAAAADTLAEENPSSASSSKPKRKRASSASKKATKKTKRGADDEEEEGEADKEEEGDDDGDETGSDDDDDEDGGDEPEATPVEAPAAGAAAAAAVLPVKAEDEEPISSKAPLIRVPVNNSERAWRAAAAADYHDKFLKKDRPAAVVGEVVFLRNTADLVQVTVAAAFPLGPITSRPLTKTRYTKLAKSGNVPTDKEELGDIDKSQYLPELTGKHLMHGIVLRNTGKETATDLLKGVTKECTRYQAHASVLKLREVLKEAEQLVIAEPDADTWTLKSGEKVDQENLEKLRARVAERSAKMHPCANEKEPNQWNWWCAKHGLMRDVYSKTVEDKKKSGEKEKFAMTLTNYRGDPRWNEVSFIGSVNYWTDKKTGKLMSERSYFELKPKEAEALHELFLRQFKCVGAETMPPEIVTTLLSEIGSPETAWSTDNRHPLGSSVRVKYGLSPTEWEACPYRYVPCILNAKRCENKTRNRTTADRARAGYALDPARPGYLLPPTPPRQAASPAPAAAASKEKKKAASKVEVTPPSKKAKAKDKDKEEVKKKKASVPPVKDEKKKAKSVKDKNKKKKEEEEEEEEKEADSAAAHVPVYAKLARDDASRLAAEISASVKAHAWTEFAKMGSQFGEKLAEWELLVLQHLKTRLAAEALPPPPAATPLKHAPAAEPATAATAAPDVPAAVPKIPKQRQPEAAKESLPSSKGFARVATSLLAAVGVTNAADSPAPVAAATVPGPVADTATVANGTSGGEDKKKEARKQKRPVRHGSGSTGASSEPKADTVAAVTTAKDAGKYTVEVEHNDDIRGLDLAKFRERVPPPPSPPQLPSSNGVPPSHHHVVVEKKKASAATTTDHDEEIVMSAIPQQPAPPKSVPAATVAVATATATAVVPKTADEPDPLGDLS